MNRSSFAMSFLAVVLLLAAPVLIGCGGVTETPNEPEGVTDVRNARAALYSAEGLLVRKSVAELSEEEKSALVEAFVKMKQIPSAYKLETLSCGPVNAYDYFVDLHMQAFGDMASHAHMSPMFLPWHREYLARLDAELQRASGDPTMTIPYWNWPDDASVVFANDFVGPTGDHVATDDPATDYPVTTGLLVERGFQVNFWSQATPQQDPPEFDVTVHCEAVPLTRNLGHGLLARTLPRRYSVRDAIRTERPYDSPPYNTTVDPDISFRNFLEGFGPEFQPEAVDQYPLIGWFMHGKVHRWVGGRMGEPSSPNDPVFFMHHANVDRIWAEWQDRWGIDNYPSEPEWNEPLFGFIPAAVPAETFDLLDMGFVYSSQQVRAVEGAE